MDLVEGERVIFEGHPSWRSIIGFYFKGLLLAALAGAAAALASRIAEDEVRSGWVVVAVAAVFLILLVIGYVKRIATTYTITTRRLHIRRGIVARHVEETRVERIQNVNTSQSVLERILQVGTVDFDVASGEREGLFRFSGVADPADVVRAIDEATGAGGTGV